MRAIDKSFGATRALADVDLEVLPGEVHALIGENGAGKSTLMKVLSGAISSDAGEMLLDGAAYRPSSPADGRRRGIAMIYQELSLAPHLSTLENIVLGVEPARGLLLDRKEARRRASDALRQVGRADIPLDLPTRKLAPAEQQLVEIARSVAIGCNLFVFDEPTSSLSQADTQHLFSFIAKLREEGHSVIYISHVLEEVKEISDRFTVLRDGRVVGSGQTQGVALDEVVEMMVGRTVKELYLRSEREPGEVLLSTTDLASVELLSSASLSLRRGEVLGVAGLIGAGRTQLMRSIFGLDPITAGEVTVAGISGRCTTHVRWKQGVGMVSEDRKNEGLALELSVSDNLCLPGLARLGRMGWFTPSAQHDATQTWIERLGIRCRSPRQRVVQLSGGNQQKVALARLLYTDVDLLLLDEPTRGVDVGSKADIYRLLDKLARGTGERPPKAVLLVSSHLPELLGTCDRIAVMWRGELGRARPVSELDEHRIMLAATGAGGTL